MASQNPRHIIALGSNFPTFIPLEHEYRDEECRQQAALRQQTSQFPSNIHRTDESELEACQNYSTGEPQPSREYEVSISLPEMVTRLQVALRASERAREEGRNESSALRRYLADVEVAAAGLVSRVQELEHLLALSTASQENKDLDQLRGQMLMVTARDARQHAIVAAQALSTARQATMQLDQVKREASALTASQEDEIKRISTELQHCHGLLQEKDILLQQKEKKEEQLMHRCSALEGAVNVSQLELTALRKKIEKEDEEKAERLQEIAQTLDFTKAAVHAAEHRLQEAQSQKKDTAIQNELLQREVADLQSREVQTTIAHYDLELCKVRAALEGEKTHLLAELVWAKLRQGNRSLKGEVAEWRAKYNDMLKKTGCGEDLVATTFEPAEISFAKLRKFFSTDCFDNNPSKPGGVAALSPAAGRLERQDNRDDQQICLLRDDDEHLNAQQCPGSRGDSFGENANVWKANLQLINDHEGRSEPLLLPERSENDHFDPEMETSPCLDNQFSPWNTRNTENGQICLAGRGDVEHEVVAISGKQLGPRPPTGKPVQGRENYTQSQGALDTEGMRKTAKKLRSVSFLDQLVYSPEDGTLAIKDETCFEMGENLLAVAHRELCKLKRASRHRTSEERDFNDMLHEGLKLVEKKMDLERACCFEEEL